MWQTVCVCGGVLSNDAFIDLTETELRMDFSGDGLCEKGPSPTEGVGCFSLM